MLHSRARKWRGALHYDHLLRCTPTHTVRCAIVDGTKSDPFTSGSLDVPAFADRLWGDIYFNEEDRKFTRKQADPEQNRTFVHFILEPLYKLYSQVVSEETEQLRETLEGLKIKLKPIMFKMDVRPLLKAVLDQFFGPSTGLVDMMVENIPSPVQNAQNKVRITLPAV